MTMEAGKTNPAELATQPGGGGMAAYRSQTHDSTNHPIFQAPISSTRTRQRADVLQAALDYAELGWRILPMWWPLPGGGCACSDPKCDSVGKHPLGTLVPNGVHDASCDPHVIREWLRAYPDCNLGLAIPAGWAAIDIDPRHGGDVQNLPLTWQDRQTLTQDTGGGGKHLVFTLPAAPAGQKWVNKKTIIGDGIDVKVFGGIIMLTPSIHESGKRYGWAPDLGPADVQPLEAPAALLSILPTVPIGWKAPATRTRAGAGQQTKYGRKFEGLLSDLCPDLDRGQRIGFVSSPFSDGDSSPSLHYNLDEGVFFDFGAGSKVADTGGGYLALRAASIRFIGYDPERQVMSAASTQPTGSMMPPLTPTAAPAAVIGPELQPAAVAYAGPLPWKLTRTDWASCPICSAIHTRIGSDRRPVAGHWLCKDRGCIVSQKVRAGRHLWPVVGWASLFVGVVADDPRSWRALRDLVKHEGGRIIGIPLGAGSILAAASVAASGLAERADRGGVLIELCAADMAAPAGARVRCAHKAPAAVANTQPAAGQAEEDQDQAPEPLPAGLRKALSLTVGPDYESDLLGCWVAVRAEVIPGPKGWTTAAALSDTQLHELAVRYADLRERILQVGRASIASIGRVASSDIETIDDMLQAQAVAPLPEHERHEYNQGISAPRRERLLFERTQQAELMPVDWERAALQ